MIARRMILKYSLNFGPDNSLSIEALDQYQYLGNCPPTPPLTQH